MSGRLFYSMMFLTVFFFACSSAWAGGEENENDKTLSPYFFIQGGDPSVDSFPLKETNVAVNISGVIADVVVSQMYTNKGTRPINARYIFPASTRAAVHGMKMTIGNKVIKARIKERQAAKQEFKKAKSEGKSAALLEQQRPNVFSMDVANVMPGDDIEIELRYTELIAPTEGIYEFVYPTVVGPRYSERPAEGAPDHDKWVRNPYLKNGVPPRTAFDIAVNISTGVPIREVVCDSHETDIAWENENLAKILLSASDDFGGNRDFILNYRLTGEKIVSGLTLFSGEDENFFLFMAQPPERVTPADIPPREYIFVVDVSGSMNGFPLNTSKMLLRNLIGGLRPTDKFNVVLFAGGSRLMAPSSLSAVTANVDKAIDMIDRQRGGGGTRLLAALRKGMSLPGDEGFSRTIVVVTDGYISAERDVFEFIAGKLDRANIFSFGIGSSVNRHLIEGMARAGQGEPFIVTRPQNAPEIAERFRKYIDAPVLTNISVKYDGFQTFAIEPPRISDLFAGRPIITFGKWRGEPRGVIEVTGITGDGEYARTIDVSGVEPSPINSALRRLWARKRISRLSDLNFGVNDKEDKAEITSLGLTYNLLTSYTSFIAVHEVIRNAAEPGVDVDQPLALPKNVSNLAVGGSVHGTPEPGLLILLLLAALIFAVHPACRERFHHFFSSVRKGLSSP